MNGEKQKISLFSAVSIGVGCVIGGGIFTMVGLGTSMTGRSVGLAFIMAMALMMLSQVRNIFMASMFALDGGQYSQQALVLPPVFTGMSVCMYVIGNFSFAVYGTMITSYLTLFFPGIAGHEKLVSILVLTCFFALALLGVKSLAKLQNFMTVCMYAALLLLIVFGLVQSGGDMVVNQDVPFFASGILGFFPAVAMVSYTCNGTYAILNLSGDLKNPKRDVVVGTLLVAAICATLYALLGYVGSLYMPIETAASLTLGDVAQQIMPHGLYIFFVIGGAIFALTTSLNGGISSQLGPIAVAADDGWLPKSWGKRLKNGFPIIILLFIYLVTIIPVIFDFTLDVIVSAQLVPGLVMNIINILLCFNLPKKYPKAWESCSLHCPYWFYCFMLILSIAASVLLAVSMLASLTVPAMLGNLALTVAIFLYSLWRLKTNKVDMQSIQNVEEGEME